MKFFVINLGSTSTKLAIFVQGKSVKEIELRHDASLLQTFHYPKEQFTMRLTAIEKYIEEENLDLSTFTAIVSRGGNVIPFKPGSYRINEAMMKILEDEINPHISNTSPRVAYHLSQKYNIPSYIYDAVSCDELSDIARLSGSPLLPRFSVGHPLNQRAVGHKYADSIGKNYNDLNLIIVHMGGGCSVGMHQKGHIVDMMCDDEGGFSPERCGALFCGMLLEAVHRGTYTYDQLRRQWRGDGGLVAYLGTNNVVEVEEMIENGDMNAKLVFDAMVYQTAKVIGCMAGAYAGKVDAILLTGGVAHSHRWVSGLKEKIGFIAPVACYPGSFEMEALALGTERALRGEEPINELSL